MGALKSRPGGGRGEGWRAEKASDPNNISLGFGKAQGADSGLELQGYGETHDGDNDSDGDSGDGNDGDSDDGSDNDGDWQWW